MKQSGGTPKTKSAAKSKAKAKPKTKAKAAAKTKTNAKPKAKAAAKPAEKSAKQPAKPTKVPSKILKTPASARPGAKSDEVVKGITKRDFDKFKKLLLVERERILGAVQGLERSNLREAAHNAGSDFNELAEVGTDNYDREVALRVASGEAELLYEIDEALKRIEDGTYGVCEGTGNPIPRKRLEVFPAARYTVEYQAQLERESYRGHSR